MGMSYSLIHIGKCGGTYVGKLIPDKVIPHKNRYHLRRDYGYCIDDKFVIWIRNPLHRFVSAFFYVKNVIEQSLESLNLQNLNIENCLSPHNTRAKLTQGHYYNERYDSLVKSFKTANELAESLMEGQPKFKIANELMHYKTEHIYKGIGWYLYNGDFIRDYHKNIFFVGTQENMKMDIDRLSEKMNIALDSSHEKIRENKNDNDKFLSPVAINNLLEFYKNSDYKALKILVDHKQITEDLLESYHKYETS